MPNKKKNCGSEGFEGTDIAYGNPTSKTLKPAGGILGKARARKTE